MQRRAINPYRPGVGTPPPYLADRERQLRAFERYLQSFPEKRQNIRLTGLRGVGKTVLLKEYRRMALAQEWVVVRRDLSKRLNNEEDFSIAISDDLRAAAEQLSTVAKVTAALKTAVNAIEQVKVGPVSVKRGDRRTPAVLEDRVRDALRRVGELAKAAERGALFLYDEAHVLADRERQKQFPMSALLGAFVEAQEDDDDAFPIMLVMSGLPTLIGNIQDARSHSERLFRAEELSNLALQGEGNGLSKAAMALVEPARESGTSFDPGTAQRVAESVDGYPYFIQKYGEALWDVADEDSLTEITDELLDRAERDIQESLDLEFFEGRYSDATPGDQRTLRVAAALGGESFAVAAVIKEFETRKGNATQQSVNRLFKNNLIYRLEQGRYGYTAPMFGDFVRRRHPRETDDR